MVIATAIIVAVAIAIAVYFGIMSARRNASCVADLKETKFQELRDAYRATRGSRLKNRDMHRKLGIVFINLDSRKDRLLNMKNDVLPYFAPYAEHVHRISAVRHTHGGKGCSMSHVKALQYAMDNGFEHTLVFEDDATIDGEDKQDMVDKCMRSFQEVKDVYDVFVCGSVDATRVMFEDPNLKYTDHVCRAHGAHAYIIHRTYLPLLKNLYEFSATHLSDIKTAKNYHEFALDQLHKQLQMYHAWFICKSNSVIQLPMYSDISKAMIHHTTEKRHTVNHCVFTFWFGPPMSAQRKSNLSRMEATLQVPVVHVTEENLSKYTRWPVHPAVKYLSANHKSDYFRIYFTLHIGGGYYDVKPPLESWKKYFDLFKEPSVWMVGIPELKNWYSKVPGHTYPKDHHKVCIANGWFIGRPNTPLLHDVHDQQHRILDKHHDQLRLHPPPFPRCCHNHENGYPLRWSELMGEITGLVVPKYYDGHVKAVMALPSVKNYL